MIGLLVYCCFFFSSRRRHTRLQGDWSSDVCSSDLHDSAQTDTEGRPASAVDEKAWTKRAGATYQMDGGWAPYLGYSESFQPLGGVDVYGTPYKAQRGEQWEAGVKWQPPGQGLSAFAAVYTLREKNRKTTDPANPLNSLQIGEVKVNGFEAELTASLARHWDAPLAHPYTAPVLPP